MTWISNPTNLADLVVSTLISDLRDDGFYLQMMYIDKGLSRCAKDDSALSNAKINNLVTIETAPEDMIFVKDNHLMRESSNYTTR
jgi:hypothetical protein